jgi:hypothetical protein
VKTDLPSNPYDRIAELELRLASLESLRDVPAGRPARYLHLDQPILARTAEPDETPAVAYPAYSSVNPILLPVISQSLDVDDDAVPPTVTLTDRTAKPRVHAASPLGWLPPDHPIHIVHRRQRWEIVRSAVKLIGIPVEAIPGATWEDDKYRLGSGTVRLWHLDPITGDYHPHLYRDDSPVEMDWYNRSPRPIAGGVITAAIRDASHRWIARLEPSLVGCCLYEDHPGRGLVFQVTLGTWHPDHDQWIYDGGLAYAIDWRHGVPYPPSGATGLFEQRPSTTYGTIWECVSLDCTSPGPCTTTPPAP